ncbi:hypothetical protein DFQ28_006904 [Apophysomyces sp. BC1034]|nr:hypothetical protein DFQ30_006109 [Apophysomyces sp. BC1015]KAG0173910.1 hypothetical protein DFQ29_007677 [Apophysomyces sp. BC1021]KAG0187084.1 hypothetical protein DFQ28_006904 [Apophysomyces sp. BC1034]
MAYNTQPDRLVIRCAKQVYNHLGLRDRITALDIGDVAALPPEIRKMQTLCLADQKELNNVVRQFLQWTPPTGSKKSLQDLLNRLDDALTDFCFNDEEVSSTGFPRTPPATSVAPPINQKRAAASELESLVIKRVRSHSCSSNGTLFTSPSTTRSSPTPPLSPFDTNETSDFVNCNVICTPPARTMYFKSVSWPIQFEIARFLTQCQVSWSELLFEALQRFSAIAKEDPRSLFHVMMEWYDYNKKGSVIQTATTCAMMERCSDHVWTHLEKTKRSLNRVLHYGGVVNLSGKQPIINLRPLQVGASNRFFRKFGEHRFLELKLHKDCHPKLIRNHIDYFLKPLLLMGRIFRFLYVKDDTIIMFATEGGGLEKISIRQVIDWHIPILENWNMTLSKFARRMALGYSNSIPTLVFDPKNVRYVDDIYSGVDGDEETCMTDGCGVISCAAMRKIMGSERSDVLPCAVQGRIGGAKGVWIVSPELDFNSEEWIEIRKSQNKFKTGVPQFDLSTDPVHYTFDLVKNAICVYPSNLNTQLIQCLAAGNVPTYVFVDLLKEYLKRLTSVVTENRNIKILRDWVAKAGSIMYSRWELDDNEKGIWREQLVDEAYVECSTDEESGEVFAVSSESENYWKYNAYSGSPTGLHESAVRLLDSGFDLSNPYVATKITHIFRDIMRSVTTKYKIEVQQSCTVTCIPDPTGTLEEGEIFLQLSKRRTDEITGIPAGLVLGKCIVARNPCGLRSDIQKVRAVDCTALRIYTDVVVFPVKGQRSLASMLGGGDYDGDIVFCCWDQRIVEPFIGSSVVPEPAKVGQAFQQNKTKVKQELSKLRTETEQEITLQKILLSVSLPDSTLGLYENWRTVMAERNSLENEDVVYLAHMCAKLVDAPKQGLVLKPAVLKRDSDDFSKIPQPPWFLDKRKKQREKEIRSYAEVDNLAAIERPLETTMDLLYDTLLEETDAFTKYSKSMLGQGDVALQDSDLATPWVNAIETATQLKDTALQADLRAIKRAIDQSCDEYNHDFKMLCIRRQQKTGRKCDSAQEEDSSAENANHFNTAFELEEFFAHEFQQLLCKSMTSDILKYDMYVNNGRMVQAIKASYAYICTLQNEKHSKYCYVVAYDTVRRIKADARAKSAKNNGLSESVVPSIYTALNLDNAWMRRLRERLSKSSVSL